MRLTRPAHRAVALLAALAVTSGSAVALGLPAASASVSAVASKRTEPAMPNKFKIKSVQAHLNELGFPFLQTDGVEGGFTSNNLCAAREVFKKDSYGKNAILADQLGRAKMTKDYSNRLLARTKLPEPRTYMRVGMNVNKTCQIAYWVGEKKDGTRYYRAIFRVSTGSKKLYEPTEAHPDGNFQTPSGVYSLKWLPGTLWSNSSTYPLDGSECKVKGPNNECGNMYRPMYFTTIGDALHGRTPPYAEILDYFPASHGCVRMYHRDIDALYDGGFANYSSIVQIYGDWVDEA